MKAAESISVKNLLTLILSNKFRELLRVDAAY